MGSKMAVIAQEIEELHQLDPHGDDREHDTDADVDEDAYATCDEDGAHDEDRARETEVHESIMQTVAQLGFPAERNSQIAHLINKDLKANGLLMAGLSAEQYDEPMRLSTSRNRSQTA